MNKTRAAAEAVRQARKMLAGPDAPVFENEHERAEAVVRLAADLLAQRMQRTDSGDCG